MSPTTTSGITVSFQDHRTERTVSGDLPTLKKTLLAMRVNGTVKWFNVKKRFAFINYNDIRENILVQQTAVTRKKSRRRSSGVCAKVKP